MTEKISEQIQMEKKKDGRKQIRRHQAKLAEKGEGWFKDFLNFSNAHENVLQIVYL